MTNPATYFLRPETVQAVLDRRHLTHQAFADSLGLSRSYWSALFHRRRALTPSVRRTLLDSAVLRGLDEALLWDVQRDEPLPEDLHAALASRT